MKLLILQNNYALHLSLWWQSKNQIFCLSNTNNNSSNVFVLSFLISHSQTIITYHPDSSNSFIFCLSRIIVLFIFWSHHSVLVFGTTKYLHFECPCQKHPLIKITVLSLGKTISGFPGEYYGQSAPPNTLQIAPPITLQTAPLKESGFVYNNKH